MKAKKRSSKAKVLLAARILEVVHDNTESFRLDDVGADLAYLTWAVLTQGLVYVNPRSASCRFKKVQEVLKKNKRLWEEVKPYIKMA